MSTPAQKAAIEEAVDELAELKWPETSTMIRAKLRSIVTKSVLAVQREPTEPCHFCEGMGCKFCEGTGDHAEYLKTAEQPKPQPQKAAEKWTVVYDGQGMCRIDCDGRPVIGWCDSSIIGLQQTLQELADAHNVEMRTKDEKIKHLEKVASEVPRRLSPEEPAQMKGKQ